MAALMEEFLESLWMHNFERVLEISMILFSTSTSISFFLRCIFERGSLFSLFLPDSCFSVLFLLSLLHVLFLF